MEQRSRPRAASATPAGSKRARRRLLQRAAAARSLARGAAIAMAADPDRSTLDLGFQQVEVAIELAVGNEDRAETLDRHVSERIEPVESDAVVLAEHAFSRPRGSA